MLMACACLLLGAPAFYVGNQTTSLGSDTGIRFPSAGGGCPALPGSPAVHYAARLEAAYADGDPVSSATDQGSQGSDFSQITGSAQPTAVGSALANICRESCVNRLVCLWRRRRRLSCLPSSFAVNSGPAITCICGVVRNDVPTNQNWYWSSQTTQATMGRWSSRYTWLPGADSTIRQQRGFSWNIARLASLSQGVYDWVCVTYSGASSNILVKWKRQRPPETPAPRTWTGLRYLGQIRRQPNDLDGAISEVLIYYDSCSPTRSHCR
jgi:hypothetical protein